MDSKEAFLICSGNRFHNLGAAVEKAEFARNIQEQLVCWPEGPCGGSAHAKAQTGRKVQSPVNKFIVSYMFSSYGLNCINPFTVQTSSSPIFCVKSNNKISILWHNLQISISIMTLYGICVPALLYLFPSLLLTPSFLAYMNCILVRYNSSKTCFHLDIFLL